MNYMKLFVFRKALFSNNEKLMRCSAMLTSSRVASTTVEVVRPEVEPSVLPVTG